MADSWPSKRGSWLYYSPNIYWALSGCQTLAKNFTGIISFDPANKPGRCALFCSLSPAYEESLNPHNSWSTGVKEHGQGCIALFPKSILGGWVPLPLQTGEPLWWQWVPASRHSQGAKPRQRNGTKSRCWGEWSAEWGAEWGLRGHHTQVCQHIWEGQGNSHGCHIPHPEKYSGSWDGDLGSGMSGQTQTVLILMEYGNQ